MKVFLIAFGMCPFAKIGRLGDVIGASSDIFFKPSWKHSCSEGYWRSFRYCNRLQGQQKETATVFLFSEISKLSLLDVLIRAMYVYRNQVEWQKLVKKAMTKQFLWMKSSEIYHDNYKRLLGGIKWFQIRGLRSFTL